MNRFLAASVIVAVPTMVFAGALPSPAAVALPGTNVFIETTPEKAAEEAASRVLHDQAVWKRRWALSLAPLVVSQALDANSSWSHREANPLLANANGEFGAKAMGMKSGAVAGAICVEYLLVRKYPRSAKFFSIVNFASAGATSSFAIHNYNLK
jgi:hypothetical protein